jgi:Uma2 family endonuclease
LLDRLGGISADRVRFRRVPGEATEQDCFEAEHRFGVLCELIDGTLVEFVSSRKLGIVAGSDGLFRVIPGQIRMPDVSFTSWARLPANDQLDAAASVAPDLAVEILSKSNTPREMDRKRIELFAGGTQLMWVIDPPTRTIAVYTGAATSPTLLDEDQSVDGGSVLPGFSFSIRQLFAEAERPQG